MSNVWQTTLWFQQTKQIKLLYLANSLIDRSRCWISKALHFLVSLYSFNWGTVFWCTPQHAHIYFYFKSIQCVSVLFRRRAKWNRKIVIAQVAQVWNGGNFNVFRYLKNSSLQHFSFLLFQIVRTALGMMLLSSKANIHTICSTKQKGSLVHFSQKSPKN